MFILTIEIDGYYRKQQLFFTSFDEAVNHLSTMSGILKDGEVFEFESMETTTMITNHETYFRMNGTPYDKMDEHDSQFGSVEIVQEKFQPKEKDFIEVVSRSGYYEEIICSQTPYSNTIGFFNTEEEAKECFKNSRYEKSWNGNCGPLKGWEGEYLDIKRRSITK